MSLPLPQSSKGGKIGESGLAKFTWSEENYFHRRVTVSLKDSAGDKSEQKSIYEASFFRTPSFLPANTWPIPKPLMPSIVEKAIDEDGEELICPTNDNDFWLATKLDITTGLLGVCFGLEMHFADDRHFPDLSKLGGISRVGICGCGNMIFCSPTKIDAP
mmetsp:Transcript_5735/g.9564  ORF Transcript_5735/g.9564 Transcript_5735/m.9564 type:complete len:160 (+) Transcript_5735:776-1255(+)